MNLFATPASLARKQGLDFEAPEDVPSAVKPSILVKSRNGTDFPQPNHIMGKLEKKASEIASCLTQ